MRLLPAWLSLPATLLLSGGWPILAVATAATPDSSLRDLSTDRPDLTESPYTVDAGHAQVEMDLVAYSRNEAGGGRSESWTVAPINVKFGLSRSADLQLIVESHRRDRITQATTGARTEIRGFGDVTIRLKRNLWGNDGGPTAAALMPFLKIPTAAEGLGNGALEFGLIAPLAVSLPSDFGLGIMGELDWLEDAAGNGRHAELTATATVGRDVAGPLGAFVEVATTVRPSREGASPATLDAGVTLAISPNAQLDAGVLLGVSDAADDRVLFLGVSVRR